MFKPVKILFFLLMIAFAAISCGGGGGSSSSGGGGETPGNAPAAPTGLSATAGNSQVVLSWNTISEATSYNLYWSTTSGVSKTNGTKINGATSQYTHSSLTNGTTYYYVVTAVNSNAEESSESSQASATPSLSPPQPPS